jgi:glucokinase
VDLGGTNLRVAALDAAGHVVSRISIPATYAAGPQRIVNDIVSAVQQIHGQCGAEFLCGVGIGVPGYIDMHAGVIVGAANLPGFEGFPIRDEIQRHLGTQIILENDANAAALGELWMGAGQNVRDMILLTLGTGIGGGIILDGKVLRGTHGMAGEFGHMTVFPDGNPCGCGNYGCLEKHASASAIVAMGRMMHFQEDVRTAAQVFDLASAGNPRAKMVFEAMGRALGIALASLMNVFNFPLYVLSGGPLPAWEFFAPTMFNEIKRRSFTYERTNPRVEKAQLGADAGLFGAAYLPFLEIMDTTKSSPVTTPV